MTNWPVKTLGDVAKWGSGGTPQSGVAEYYDGDIPWCVIGDLTEGDVWTTEKCITAAGLSNSSAKIVEVGAILIAMYGASIGRTGVVRSRMATNQAIAFAYANEEVISSDYLLKYLQSQRSALNIAGRGSAQPNISQQVLKAWSIPVPPLEEQKRIVELLDAVTARVTELNACYEQARILANNLYESACRSEFDDQQSKSPTVTLPVVSQNFDGRRKPITKSDRNAGDVPYYGASGIVDYVKGHIFDERTLLISEDGANLLARSTPIAFKADGRYWVNNHAHVLKFENAITETYVEIYLNSISIDKWVTGAAQPKLTQAALNRIPIPMPPIDEQKQIVTRLHSMRLKTSEMIAAYDAKLAASKNLRQSILEAAFAGDL